MTYIICATRSGYLYAINTRRELDLPRCRYIGKADDLDGIANGTTLYHCTPPNFDLEREARDRGFKVEPLP